MKKTLCIVLCAIMMVCVLTACGGGETSGGDKTVVHFLNWGDYIDMDVIAQFEKENPDIEIKLTTVPSNEEMYIVATTAGSDVDLIIPSEYMAQRLIAEDQLAPIDTSKMENYQYVESYTNTYPFEGSKEYTVPYAWGTFGILYNTTMVSEPVDSWGVLWDEQYAGKIYMYDSIRDTIGLALKYLGYSMNSTDQTQIDEATEMLIAQKALTLAYGTDELRMSMVNESGAIAPMYAGDAVYAMEDNENLAYVIPKEGSNIFVDSFCIMKNTDCYDATLRFVDFLCRPEIAAKNAEYTGYSSPVTGAEEYFEDQSLLENNAYNPSEEELKNVEYYTCLGDDIKMYDEAWIKIKTS